MRIGDARDSTTEQNLGLRHDDLKPAYDASVDVTDARRPNDQGQQPAHAGGGAELNGPSFAWPVCCSG